jgi:L-lysine exporter family protein LysE/ArgO
MLLGDASAFQVGLAMGSASIISLGPNNLMILREGLARGRVGFVATIVFSSFAALIAASQLLATWLLEIDAGQRIALSWVGVAMILVFALRAFRTAWRGRGAAGPAARRESAGACFLRVARVVWANPLTYVERLLAPAALGQAFAGTGAQYEFVLALLLTAALSCFGYAYGSRLVSAAMRGTGTVRVFDTVSGLVLLAVAFTMAGRLLFGMAG